MILTEGHLGKFKVTGRKMVEIVLDPYLSYGENIGSSYFMLRLLMTRGSVVIVQGH